MRALVSMAAAVVLSTTGSGALAASVRAEPLAVRAAKAMALVSTAAPKKKPPARTPSADVATAVARVAATNDHAGRPFVVIDKRRAMLWVFDAQARRRAGTPVLLGLARGDDTVPGIGDKPLKEILDHERTTPAGRFAAERGKNLAGDDIIWVDYDSAVSMHRVRSVSESERRLQRLASATPADNRISYGCINVPAAFFDRHLWPWVGQYGKPLLVVLPETRAVGTLFASEGR